jgi:hypothetical protein
MALYSQYVKKEEPKRCISGQLFNGESVITYNENFMGKLKVPKSIINQLKYNNELKTQYTNNGCANQGQSQSKKTKKICNKININSVNSETKKAFADLSKHLFERVITRLYRFRGKRSQKRLDKLSCALSAYIETLENRNCNDNNNRKYYIDTLNAELTKYVNQTGPFYVTGVLNTLKFIYYNYNIPLDEIKKDDKTLEYIIKFFEQYQNPSCS